MFADKNLPNWIETDDDSNKPDLGIEIQDTLINLKFADLKEVKQYVQESQ